MTTPPGAIGGRLVGSTAPHLRGNPEREEVSPEHAEPQVEVSFICTQCTNTTILRFAASADPVAAWDCSQCGAQATIDGEPVARVYQKGRDPEQHRPAWPGSWATRNHLNAVHSRRTNAELEALLDEARARIPGYRAPTAKTA